MATVEEKGLVKASIPIRVDYNNPYPTGEGDVRFIVDGDYVDIRIDSRVSIAVDKNELKAVLMLLILTDERSIKV
ncbi:MAG: hypothetical protein KAR42_15255 [candidate division Zixibacteria bacterium]|nr:hypothetical protein [candidate division Zixibacteria bacterium]